MTLKRRVKALEAANEPPKPPLQQIILFQFAGEPPPSASGKPGTVVVQLSELDEKL